MPEITYLMGVDRPGSPNAFYANAFGYFTQIGSVVVASPAGGQTLEAVFKDLRKRATGKPPEIYDTINLVSHASGFSSLNFGLTAADHGFTGAARLTNAVAAATTKTPDPAPLGPPAVTTTTHIRLYGCDVGKDEVFVHNLGLLFGLPADIAAPVRIAVFGHGGGVFTHRLARSWTVHWATNIASPAPTPATLPAFRKAFVTAAELKFEPAWLTITGDPLPGGFALMLKPIADLATLDPDAAAFFFPEWMSAPPNTNETLRSVTMKLTRDEVNDLTVANVVAPIDYTQKTATEWRAWSAVLAQVLTETPSLTNGLHYRVVRVAPEVKPSPGPKTVPDGGQPAPAPGPPKTGAWQEVRDDYLAAGGDPTDLDELIAGLGSPATDLELAEASLVLPDVGDDPIGRGAPV